MLLGLTYALVIPQLEPKGNLPWNEGSNYALVRALAHGTASVDPYAWQTGDLSYYRGHYFSVRAPGLSFLELPWYETLRVGGVPSEGRNVPGTHVRASGALGMLWGLTLLGAVLPGVLLVLLLRRLADRIEPGFGTLTAVTAGAATLILPFSTMLFVHVLSALLVLGSFALLERERRGPMQPRMVLAAGLVAGLAAMSEYGVAVSAPILALYAASRGRVLSRLVAYCAGFAAGVVPLLVYNRWAFGSVFHLSYADAISERGRSGHDVLGLNSPGLFGVQRPRVRVALELLFANRGLFVLAPVLACAAVGVVILYRRSRRAESGVIVAIALAFLVYDSGYINPFGGDSPGPRFLIATIPFLALALGPCFRRFPGPTLALAAASATMMLIALVAQPLLLTDDTGVWRQHLASGDLKHSVLSWLGVGNGWAVVAPFLLAGAGAAVLAARSAPLSRLRAVELRNGILVLLGWGVVAILAPIVVVPGHPARLGGAPLIAVGAAAGVAALLAAANVRSS